MKKNIAVQQVLNYLKTTHENVEKTMEGVTDEVAQFMPPGKANPIAGTYAHLLFGEDWFVQGFIRQTKTLFETDWKDKTGISEPHPTEWTTEYPKWLKEVKIDTKKVHDYAQAVFKTSEDYVASLTDEDLERPVDMSAFGMGELSVGYILGNMVIGHANNIMGEISALKGIQGLKGYPF